MKDPKQQAKGERMGQGETLHPLPLFLFYLLARQHQTQKGAKISPYKHETGQGGQIYQTHTKNPAKRK